MSMLTLSSQNNKQNYANQKNFIGNVSERGFREF